MKHLFLFLSAVLFFACTQPAKKKQAIDVNDIKAAIVEVQLMDSSSLFILLSEDGTINRKGDLKSRDKNLFMGISPEPYFHKLKETITNDLLSYCGQTHIVADTLKKVSRITIAFSGSGIDTGFEYITDEQVDQLPKPILEFINRAIQVTDPWYNNQRNHTQPKGHKKQVGNY